MKEKFAGEEELDDFMTAPDKETADLLAALEGDVMVLGIGGKMGSHLGLLLKRSIDAAGLDKKVFGVSRFSDPKKREALERKGIRTLACDLLDPDAVAELPKTPSVVYMAGKKFGTSGAEEETWASNTIIPVNVCRRFSGSRIAVFSTGCVYAFMPPESGGSRECDRPAPVGEYAQSALGRERVFGYYSRNTKTAVCIIRLNYSIDMRYGVLFDIAEMVYHEKAVDLETGWVNVIWQGDAVRQAVLCLGQCSTPANVINITGPETISVRAVAEEFGRRFGKDVRFEGRESSAAYLSNAGKAAALFGYPRVSLGTMIGWTAHWIKEHKARLSMPTHFQKKDGEY
jgi:nucleoside-diphosphate-sugar epimerase